MVCPRVRRPSRSASSMIRRTGRSFTDPPGLNHSALTYTSTAGGRSGATRGGPRAAEQLEGHVHAQRPAGDEMARDAGGQPGRGIRDGEDVLLFETGKDDDGGDLAVFTDEGGEIFPCDAIDACAPPVGGYDLGQQC